VVTDHPWDPDVLTHNLVSFPWHVFFCTSNPRSSSLLIILITDNPDADTTHSEEDIKARSLVEKKTAINLLVAFAVSVKVRTL
jgi:hypothetical protein